MVSLDVIVFDPAVYADPSGIEAALARSSPQPWQPRVVRPEQSGPEVLATIEFVTAGVGGAESDAWAHWPPQFGDRLAILFVRDSHAEAVLTACREALPATGAAIWDTSTDEVAGPVEGSAWQRQPER